jgi:ABC-type uncharacterized transport system substrate-binding protein
MQRGRNLAWIFWVALGWTSSCFADVVMFAPDIPAAHAISTRLRTMLPTTEFSVTLWPTGQPPSDAKLMEAVARKRVAVVFDVAVAKRLVTLTPYIPVVFHTRADPLAAGLVETYSPRRANITGISFHLPNQHKTLELIEDAFPRSRVIGVVGDAFWAADPETQALLRMQGRRELRPFIVEGKNFLSPLMNSQGIDVWWIPPTPARLGQMAAFAQQAQLRGQPIVVGKIEDLHFGAALASEAVMDDPWVRLTKIVQLAMATNDASWIPVERPSRHIVALNPRVPLTGMNPRIIRRLARIDH